ncbi:MAG: hypothetical protein KDC39_08980 [Actinobacteria bacterium]|nr:hypothetical protein [Actinomycetota bacterium]
MAGITTALGVLTQTYPSPGDLPDDRSAGYWGFLLFLLMLLGVVLLWFSLNKQLKRINFDEGDEGNKAKADSEPSVDLRDNAVSAKPVADEQDTA